MAQQLECDSILGPNDLQAVLDKIEGNPVVLFALPDVYCTAAAESTFANKGVCYVEQTLTGEDDPTLLYMKCIHADSIGEIGSSADNMYHSYLYVGGKYIGDGFKAEDLTDYAGAEMTCGVDCSTIISAEDKQEMEDTIANNAVVLYGWGGCPCTGIAQSRLEALGTCYVQSVWPDTEDPAFKYLQCVHGDDNHSFLFFKGEFYGNGFMLDPKDLSDEAFQTILDDAGAVESCVKSGDKNLGGGAISSCTQSDDGTTTGYTRSGSCSWDPTDGGYHEVCVTMSDEFLTNSAEKDGNDLSSVVAGGGHWCICAWAFASAVQRDPENLEGIHLECGRTNDKLREVYQHYIDEGKQLESPSGISYEASTALEYVDKLCGEGGTPTAVESAEGGEMAAAALREQQVAAHQEQQRPEVTKSIVLTASAGIAAVCILTAVALVASRRSKLAQKGWLNEQAVHATPTATGADTPVVWGASPRSAHV
jgi:uncharacterized protein (DUF2237 family)